MCDFRERASSSLALADRRRLTRWAASHPLPLVQKAAGHASIKTTMGYVHLQDEDLNALVVSAPKPNEKAG